MNQESLKIDQIEMNEEVEEEEANNEIIIIINKHKSIDRYG